MDKISQLYKDQTIMSARNTIMTKMEEIRGASEEDKQIARRRWIWELIQNASDCASSQEVTIWIECSDQEMRFSHNGSMFTQRNLMDLITQISSKRTENDDTVGKFGTGFISTHLISEVVRIRGVYQNEKHSSDFKELEIEINRSGKTEDEISESIINALSKLESIDKSNSINWQFNENQPTTSFHYDLSNKMTNEVSTAIKAGCNDLDASIPYVFAFSDKIKDIHYNGEVYSCIEKKLLTAISSMSVYWVCTAKRKDEANYKYQYILVCKDNRSDISIAIAVENVNNEWHCCSLRNTPKLFCSFPLVGTEHFAFPIVLNSPSLKVLRERNSIQEGAPNNGRIFGTASELYKQMLNYLSINNYNKIYHLCRRNNFNQTEMQKKLFHQIQDIYQLQAIVPLQEKWANLTGIVKSSLYHINTQGKKACTILIPFMNKDKQQLSNMLWDIMNGIRINLPLPSKDSFLQWAEVSPDNRYSLDMLIKKLLEDSHISHLSRSFSDIQELLVWLNNLYELWILSLEGEQSRFKSDGIVPNQNGKFVNASKIYIDNGIDEELKEILCLLGTDIKAQLLHSQIVKLNDIDIPVLDNDYVAKEISDYVRKQLSSESANATKRTDEIQIIYNRLTDWFMKNQDIAKSLFNDIYEKQHQLSSIEENIRRFSLATTIEEDMRKHNMDLEQLRALIERGGELLRLSEEGKLSLAPEVQKLFHHIITKSQYSAERYQSLKNRSIKNIYKYLSSNHQYSLDATLEEWIQNRYSETVFQAEKNGKHILIIIRPSDDNKIIFYEEPELEALDNTNCELWTDNGRVVKMVTLGDILKTTGITEIPLKNIFVENMGGF